MNVSQNSGSTRFDSQIKPSVLLKLAGLQALFTLVFGAALFFCFDAREAVSGLIGGFTATVMTLFMAGRLFSAYRISQIREIPAGEALVRFYISVVLKIVFTVMMMVICIVVIKVSILPFIIAYLIAAVIVNWLALLVLH